LTKLLDNVKSLKQVKFGGNHASIIDVWWAINSAEKEHFEYHKYTI